MRSTGVDTGELFFSFNRNPRHYVDNGVTDPKLDWFTDLNFLRAIAHAIDKQGMINLCFHGLGSPGGRRHLAGQQDFLQSQSQGLRLRSEDGGASCWKPPDIIWCKPGVRVDPHGHPLVFNLTTNTGVPVRDQMCAIFKQDLATSASR